MSCERDPPLARMPAPRACRATHARAAHTAPRMPLVHVACACRLCEHVPLRACRATRAAAHAAPPACCEESAAAHPLSLPPRPCCAATLPSRAPFRTPRGRASFARPSSPHVERRLSALRCPFSHAAHATRGQRPASRPSCRSSERRTEASTTRRACAAWLSRAPPPPLALEPTTSAGSLEPTASTGSLRSPPLSHRAALLPPHSSASRNHEAKRPPPPQDVKNVLLHAHRACPRLSLASGARKTRPSLRSRGL
eukprot:3911350-Prymnesium_polylepis.1